MTPADPAGPSGPEGRLEATASAALGGADVVGVTPLGGEGAYSVAAVDTAAGERFVLKCAPPDVETAGLRREAAVTAHVGRETGVPVPAVVDAAFDPPAPAAPYVVFRWVQGRTLAEAEAAAPRPVLMGLFRDLGETLADLHGSLAFDAPGTVEPAGPDGFDVATGDPWPETVAAELADHVDALVGTRFETLAEDCWDRLVGRLPTLDTGEPAALLHGDVGDGNVLVDGEGVTGLLDWERAAVGHPEYDLCRAEVRCFWSGWGRRDALSSMLYAGYRSRRSIPDGFDGRRRAYLVTSYLLSLASFEDWGPRYADDLDELAGAVAEKVRELLPDGS